MNLVPVCWELNGPQRDYLNTALDYKGHADEPFVNVIDFLLGCVDHGVRTRGLAMDHGGNVQQEKPSGGCSIWLAIALIGGLVRFAMREAQKPAPPPPRATPQEAARAQELLTSSMTTIEYVNDSTQPCTVLVRGNSGRHKQRVLQQLPAGPGQSALQSTFPFSVTEIVVNAEGQVARTEIAFLLPPGGLSEIRVASDLSATWKKLKDKHPPNDHGVLPANDDLK